MITSVVHIYPMFHAMDSTMKAHIENGRPISSVLSDSNMQQPQADAAVHPHGVQKNLMDHKQSLMDHIAKERAKRREKMTHREGKNEGKGNDAKKLDGKASKKMTKKQADHKAEKDQPMGDIQSSKKEKGHVEAPSINAKPTGKIRKEEDVGKQAKKLEEQKKSSPEKVDSNKHLDQQKSSPEKVEKKEVPSPSNGNEDSSRPNVNQKLARGFSGLPMDKTPALVGAKRGTVECDIDVKYVSL